MKALTPIPSIHALVWLQIFPVIDAVVVVVVASVFIKVAVVIIVAVAVVFVVLMAIEQLNYETLRVEQRLWANMMVVKTQYDRDCVWEGVHAVSLSCCNSQLLMFFNRCWLTFNIF